MTHYLSAEEILIIHSLVVEESGGVHGVRDSALLESIVERPKASFAGADLHASLTKKAAVLCEGLVNYHVFIDGNTRTAFLSLARFLHINGHACTASNEMVVETMIAIADKSMQLEDIANWIDTYFKKS